MFSIERLIDSPFFALTNVGYKYFIGTECKWRIFTY